jgi:hypothetical protein
MTDSHATPDRAAIFLWENLDVWSQDDGTLHVAPKSGYEFTDEAWIKWCDFRLPHAVAAGECGPGVVMRIGPLVLHGRPRDEADDV